MKNFGKKFICGCVLLCSLFLVHAEDIENIGVSVEEVQDTVENTEVSYDKDESGYVELDGLLKKDFSMWSLKFKNEGSLMEIADNLTLDERMKLYNRHKKKGWQISLNIVNFGMGIGSYAQKDNFFATVAAINCVLGWGITYGGLCLGAMMQMFQIICLPEISLGLAGASEESKEKFNAEWNYFNAVAKNIMIGGSIIGGSIILCNMAFSFLRSTAVYRNYNAQLARVLGVSDIDVALVPSFTSSASPKGVSLALALKL